MCGKHKSPSPIFGHTVLECIFAGRKREKNYGVDGAGGINIREREEGCNELR